MGLGTKRLRMGVILYIYCLMAVLVVQNAVTVLVV